VLDAPVLLHHRCQAIGIGIRHRGRIIAEAGARSRPKVAIATTNLGSVAGASAAGLHPLDLAEYSCVFLMSRTGNAGFNAEEVIQIDPICRCTAIAAPHATAPSSVEAQARQVQQQIDAVGCDAQLQNLAGLVEFQQFRAAELHEARFALTRFARVGRSHRSMSLVNRGLAW